MAAVAKNRNFFNCPLLEVGITGHKFGRRPPKDHSTKIWLQLAQWFLRRRLKCEMWTDDGRKVMATTKMAAKLKILKKGDEIQKNLL
jgi:hypothetical protein